MAAAAARDRRAVLPIGSVEQRAQLSLCVDMILAEKVALDAAEPLGLPVLPVMPFGLAPYFADYPGTVTLQMETLLAEMRDVLASIRRAGFQRILIVTGLGGNAAVDAQAQELFRMIAHPFLRKGTSGPVAAMAIDDQNAAKSLMCQPIPNVAYQRETGLRPYRDRAGMVVKYGVSP